MDSAALAGLAGVQEADDSRAAGAVRAYAPDALRLCAMAQDHAPACGQTVPLATVRGATNPDEGKRESVGKRTETCGCPA